MKCPKCGHEQANTELCESCGIYFEKYNQFLQNRELMSASTQKPEEADHGHTSFLSAGVKWVAGLVVIGVGYYVFIADTDNQPTAVAAGPEVPLANSVEPGTEASGVRARLDRTHKPRNAIEVARNATVFIETEWGTLGSGFIYNADCQVVTNRHVLEFDTDEAALAIAASSELGQEFHSERNRILRELQELRHRYREAVYGQGAESQEAIMLRQEITAKVDELKGLPQELQRSIDEEVSSAEFNARLASYKVSLVDGVVYEIRDIHYSDEHDLATFSLPETDCPHINAGDSNSLIQGDRLYTIGSPSGLTYTVTAGIFSGYRTDAGDIFLQTDAPINPGNSGGPLITEAGDVVGINTSYYRDTQGIGFAIPIELVIADPDK